MRQLALIRAFVRGARKQGTLDDGFRKRASEIVERTAAEMTEQQDDDELSDLLVSIREELGALDDAKQVRGRSGPPARS